jgi:hypothetical protein
MANQISDSSSIAEISPSAIDQTPQLDNLKIDGVRQGSVDFLGNVLRNLYISNNANSNTSTLLNTINQFNDIVYADNLRITNAGSTSTLKYQSNSALQTRHGNFVDATQIQTTSGYIPDNFDSTKGVFVKAYDPVILEKNFTKAQYTSNSKAVTNFINNTLDFNNTYSTQAVTSSLDYALQNGYVTDWSTLNSTSFNTAVVTDKIQQNAELSDSLAKSYFLQNNMLT